MSDVSRQIEKDIIFAGAAFDLEDRVVRRTDLYEWLMGDKDKLIVWWIVGRKDSDPDRFLLRHRDHPAVVSWHHKDEITRLADAQAWLDDAKERIKSAVLPRPSEELE